MVLILTPENTTFDIDRTPDIIDDDVRYCVLDYSNQQEIDFVWIPLVFLDTFPRPSADLQIGKYRIQIPLDWSIVIADKNFGNVEIIELKSINDRDFTVFAMNPCKGYMPSFLDISIENIFPDMTWTFPKLKYGHILAVPLTSGENPLCCFCVRDIQKLPEVLDISKIF